MRSVLRAAPCLLLISTIGRRQAAACICFGGKRPNSELDVASTEDAVVYLTVQHCWYLYEVMYDDYLVRWGSRERWRQAAGGRR